MLEPEDFGSYMAVGSRKGHQELIVFLEVDKPFDGPFDWKYAEKKCVHHEDGRPKHSVYLSIYRALENIPVGCMGALYLVTKDGKSVKLTSVPYETPENLPAYYVYQELCPVTPQVVSRLDPAAFAQYLTREEHKIHLPKMVFTDLKRIDFDDLERMGNLGGIYDRKIEHLRLCIKEVTEIPDKINKTLTRQGAQSFTYQAIDRGFYVADKDHFLHYPMFSLDELRANHYYWAKSALIL